MAVKSSGAHHNAYFNGDYNLLLNKVSASHLTTASGSLLRQQVAALLCWSAHLYGINNMIRDQIFNMIILVYKYTILTRTVSLESLN